MRPVKTFLDHLSHTSAVDDRLQAPLPSPEHRQWVLLVPQHQSEAILQGVLVFRQEKTPCSNRFRDR